MQSPACRTSTRHPAAAAAANDGLLFQHSLAIVLGPMALLVAGGFGIAGAGLVVATGYRKVKASFASKGVEHLLSEEERESLQAEHMAKIKECAGASGMKMGVRSSLHFLKVPARGPPAIESTLTMSRMLQRRLGLSF